MDTRTANRSESELEALVKAGIELIKTRMPETYKSIQAREKGVVEEVGGKPVVMVQAYGKAVYNLVRRGLRGEPNMFYAFERGHVVGTPFSLPEIARDVAQAMVSFGCTHACIFAPVPVSTGEAAHGA